MQAPGDNLPTIDHLGFLEDVTDTPSFLRHGPGHPPSSHYSCAYCGVGDGGTAVTEAVSPLAPTVDGWKEGDGILQVGLIGAAVDYPARLREGGRLEVETGVALAAPDAVILGKLQVGGESRTVILRVVGSQVAGCPPHRARASLCGALAPRNPGHRGENLPAERHPDQYPISRPLIRTSCSTWSRATFSTASSRPNGAADFSAWRVRSAVPNSGRASSTICQEGWGRSTAAPNMRTGGRLPGKNCLIGVRSYTAGWGRLAWSC